MRAVITGGDNHKAEGRGEGRQREKKNEYDWMNLCLGTCKLVNSEPKHLLREEKGLTGLVKPNLRVDI